jgi:hypothetical protein
MAENRELADVQRAKAYRVGEVVILVVAGDKPTPCHEVDIQQLPIRIFPPQYSVVLSMNPLARCANVVTPYERSELFRLGDGNVESLTLHTAGGTMDVPVETLDAPDGGAVPSDPDEAVGYSRDWDLGEAMQDAIAKLPPGEPHPDQLSTYTVVEIGAQVGGIAGFNHLTVRVRGG